MVYFRRISPCGEEGKKNVAGESKEGWAMARSGGRKRHSSKKTKRRSRKSGRKNIVRSKRCGGRKNIVRSKRRGGRKYYYSGGNPPDNDVTFDWSDTTTSMDEEEQEGRPKRRRVMETREQVCGSRCSSSSAAGSSMGMNGAAGSSMGMNGAAGSTTDSFPPYPLIPYSPPFSLLTPPNNSFSPPNNSFSPPNNSFAFPPPSPPPPPPPPPPQVVFPGQFVEIPQSPAIAYERSEDDPMGALELFAAEDVREFFVLDAYFMGFPHWMEVVEEMVQGMVHRDPTAHERLFEWYEQLPRRVWERRTITVRVGDVRPRDNTCRLGEGGRRRGGSFFGDDNDSVANEAWRRRRVQLLDGARRRRHLHSVVKLVALCALVVIDPTRVREDPFVIDLHTWLNVTDYEWMIDELVRCARGLCNERGVPMSIRRITG